MSKQVVVHKFGGASVKSADAVRNVALILKEQDDPKMIVVVSAMGKMTNKLEEIHNAWTLGNDWQIYLTEFKEFHKEIIDGLFEEEIDLLDPICDALYEHLQVEPSNSKAFEYDKIVAFGELLSTQIVESYLSSQGFASEWMDVRNVIITDNKHQDANVDWDKSGISSKVMQNHLESGLVDVLVTQGFIARSALGNTTTLGREGSDYSGAILAYLTNADSLIIWKDVPGMLNADPKRFNNTVILPRISYREAIELSYYGASVIHPKTIKPLQNKEIPLFVRSFSESLGKGTRIDASSEYDQDVPSYIYRAGQTLVSISPKDFSFIVEENLSDIFQVLSETGVRINLMQNSAISFSIVMDTDEGRRIALMNFLEARYNVRYNDGLKLLTIRHYDKSIMNELTTGSEILLEQRSRQTLRMALRDLPESVD